MAAFKAAVITEGFMRVIPMAALAVSLSADGTEVGKEKWTRR
jgi:hypothetical protein